MKRLRGYIILPEHNLRCNVKIRASLNFEAACRWLGFRVDFCGSTYAMFIAFGVIFCVEYDILNISTELVGITLIYALNLCGVVSWGVRNSLDLRFGWYIYTDVK